VITGKGIIAMESKLCTFCGRLKPKTEFYWKIKSEEIRQSRCKECTCFIQKQRYQKDAKVREETKHNAEKWVKNNPKKRKNIAHKYRQANKEYLNKTSMEWYQENKVRLRPIRNAYQKRRREEPEYKLAYTMRYKMVKAIKNNQKYCSALKLVGCSVSELKKHIENQFEQGMTWNNWTPQGWHIDHIIPISSFDLSKKEEQEKCFHYSNLQPLWAEDNFRKSNKLPDYWQENYGGKQ
jgi:isocitrate lyase